MKSVDDLCTLIREHVNPMQAEIAETSLCPDTPLLASGLLDSMAVVQLVSSLELEFGIVIPERAIMAANFRTPSQLWDMICQLRAKVR